MARRPTFGQPDDVLSREHLKQITENLLRLSPPAVLDFYQRAYRECRIINSSTFLPARAMQELGTACGHYAETLCSDCGTSLCSAHTERCGLCSETFCASCLTFHLAHLSDHPKVVQ